MRYAVVVLALLAALLVSFEARGQGCYRLRSVVTAPSYHAPVVVHKAVHHDYHYVPKVVELVQPDYYYSVNSYYRDQLLADAIAYRILTGQQKGVGPTPQQDGTPRLRQTHPMPRAEGEAAPAGFRTAVKPELAQLVANSCVRCHNGSNPDRVDLSNPETVPLGVRGSVVTEVSAGTMPQGGKPLDEAQTQLFYEWYQAAKSKR